MINVESPVPEHLAISPRRSANGRTPPGYRVLHVIVPEQTFNHVKAQSYLSGMRFPEYVARLLNEAWPYNDSRLPSGQDDAHAHPAVNDQRGQT